MNWGYYPPYVSVAERKSRAQRKLKILRKKKPDIQPIIIEGKGLARTWWGKAWNANLERYADYRNRIGRGRSYVKNGFVLDLKISKGTIDALVMGSESQPYSIRIKITGLTAKKWAAIKKKSKDKIESLQELLDGKFPRDLEELFTAQGTGLFPSPREIKLSCSCPDWATMCKHVAAALYGVGAKLDAVPELFFSLRGVDVGDLVYFAVNKRKTELLDSMVKNKKSSRFIEGDDVELANLFDIDFAKPGKLKPIRKTSKKKAKPIAKKVAKKSVNKKPVKRKTTKKKITKKKITKKIARKAARKIGIK